jgi:hypothetical protein
MALAAQLRLGLNGIRVLFWYFGVVYLIASTGRPWWLVEVIRYTGFLQSIRNNTVLRIVLLALGLGTLAFAALAPWDQALPRL